jgi:ribosomal protein S4
MSNFYITKYKALTKDLSSTTFNLSVQSRVYNFKKSKWKAFKNFLIKNQKSRETFFLLDRLYVKKHTWKKVNKTYKSSLILKNFLNLYYNRAFSHKQLKKCLIQNSSSIHLVFAKLFFRVDVFLWKLNVFSTTREARQNIFNKNIILNSQAVDSLYLLKKGDIISLINCNLTKTSFLYYNFLFSFCEIDFYTKKIVILKNFDEFSIKDFSLIFKNKIEFQLLKQYFL